MTRLRTARNAGWRAGMAGTGYRDCPLTGLRRHFWLAGREAGVKESLTRWLKEAA